MKIEKLIIGGIAGDIIGSIFEFNNNKCIDFELFCDKSIFTDDSVLTIATMDALLNDKNYTHYYQTYSRNYPNRGYGGQYFHWIYNDNPQPYNSFGNGSAMRVSPVGWYCNSINEVLTEAKHSAEVTHNHPEGIKGAQAIASAVFLARIGSSKAEIKEYIENTFNYNLNKTIDEIRPNYEFDVTCQGSVPESIIAFIESTNFENAIRLAKSIGGDTDTIACITGSIAEAFYKYIPDNIIENVFLRLPNEMIKVIRAFSEKYR